MTVLEFPNPGGSKGIPRMRLEGGDMFADIILDQRSRPDAYYVIVQRHGSPRVYSLDRHGSLEEARHSAERALRSFVKKAA